jgi:uncharacterized membrane protein
VQQKYQLTHNHLTTGQILYLAVLQLPVVVVADRGMDMQAVQADQGVAVVQHQTVQDQTHILDPTTAVIKITAAAES